MTNNVLNIHDIDERAHTMLRRFYGYSSFRPMQLEIIRSILSGRDTIVLMPTGGGKSITFQIPSLMMDGCTIVVTPLIALMHDQVAALCANGIPAATVNSSQSDSDNRTIIEAMANGHIKLLYISPERLLADMPRWSNDIRINFIAIDEAHCISRWGHDFRPDYTRLSEIRHMRPDLPVMALTATADRLCREDIGAQLEMKNPALFVSSFDRPNIDLTVLPNPGTRQRIDTICSLIERHPFDSGIVYCLSRKGAESVNEALRDRGYKSEVYHAGLPAEQRQKAQNRFKSGTLQAICATVAFGMGINKSNIRWIVHTNMPANIESYYQEIGRAGRDGMPAKAIMFYSMADLITLRNFAEQSGQSAINAEKLKRMQQYAESMVCRRRILLSYFGETATHDCGHCDVCRNAPARYDASTPVRMAMSAAIRVGQQAGASMLVDILRGSARADLMARGFNRIKTYGAGHDIPAPIWNATLLQMLQMGFIEIAYNMGGRITVTDYGRRILMSQEPIMLPVPEVYTEHRTKQRKQPKTVITPDEQLLIDLKKTRTDLSAKLGIPADMILGDQVLAAIVSAKPVDFRTFAGTEGIGDRKAVRYSLPFLRTIRKSLGMTPPQIASPDITLYLLKREYMPHEIAGMRDIKQSTVYGHIARLIDDGKYTDFDRIVSPSQYKLFVNTRNADPTGYIDQLKNRLPDGMITLLLAIDRKYHDKTD